MFRASAVAAVAARGLPVGQCLDVLAEAEILDDDRTPAIETWFARQVAELPAPMIDELRLWFEVLSNGSSQTPVGDHGRPSPSRPV